MSAPVALAELSYGVDRATDPLRRSELFAWLSHTVRPMFVGRTLAVTEDILLRWRVLLEEGRKTGRTFSQPDLLIAATALEHDLTLVTCNIKDFSGLSITILNPWESQT